MRQDLCNDLVSVCLSVCSILRRCAAAAACGGFAAVGPAGGKYRLKAAGGRPQQQRRCSTVFNSKGEQYHVYIADAGGYTELFQLRNTVRDF